MKRSVFILIIAFFPTVLPAQNTMRFTYFNNFPPLSWEDESGHMRGILVDTMTEAIQTRMGIPVSHKGYPWARAQKLVEQGDADAFISLPTPERRSYANVSNESVLIVAFTLFVKRDHPEIEALRKVKAVAHLKGFKVGAYIGSGWGVRNLIDTGMDVDLACTIDRCLKKLIGGRFDVFIDVSQAVSYRIRELGYRGKIVELPNILDAGEFQLCIGKKSLFGHILTEYDGVMRDMKRDGTLKKISETYE